MNVTIADYLDAGPTQKMVDALLAEAIELEYRAQHEADDASDSAELFAAAGDALAEAIALDVYLRGAA